MKIGLITEQRYLRQEMPVILFNYLKNQAINVDLIVTDGGLFDPQQGILQTPQKNYCMGDYAAFIYRSRSALGLNLLSYAARAGAFTINRPEAIQSICNKAEMTLALTRAAIPTPATYFTDHVANFMDLPQEKFPLILKPTYGNNAQGLLLAHDKNSLADIQWRDDLVLAQSYLPNSGFDLKLYVCGDSVFGVRKPSPLRDLQPASECVCLDTAAIDLARHCGKLFGLEIYGVDTIETDDGPIVIEVNDFPNFTGVAQAPGLITELVLAQVR